MGSRPRSAPCSPRNWTPAQRAAIRRRLLRWYDRHKRHLPWRTQTNDPYAQWVAEIMLQQTKVETVVNYYDRFLRRFPTIPALAWARTQTVLKAWEGLGYYRRALNLHRGARLLARLGQTVPASVDQLRRLPGVGEYTAAALSSIAFGQRAAAVDGNVARILSRLGGLSADILTAPGKAAIRDMAEELIPRRRPGDFNQAWMDLGNAVCRPRTPQCAVCPLQSVCMASKNGDAGSLPVRNGGRSTTVPCVSRIAVVFVQQDRVLLRRRPDSGLWAGLWEFPNQSVRKNENHRSAIERLAEQFTDCAGGDVVPVGTIRHRLTHRLFVFHAYVCRLGPTATDAPGSKHRWFTLADMNTIPVSTAHRRIFTIANVVVAASA